MPFWLCRRLQRLIWFISLKMREYCEEDLFHLFPKGLDMGERSKTRRLKASLLLECIGWKSGKKLERMIRGNVI